MSSKDEEDVQGNVADPAEESGKGEASLEDISNDENSQISEGSFICEEEEYEKVSEDGVSEIQSPSSEDDSPKSPEPEPSYVKMRSSQQDNVRTVDALDGELDFEADDKEDLEEEKHKKPKNRGFDAKDGVEEVSEEEDDLEEGEVKEEEETGRPKTPPQSVCRFYSQGHCTWGPSCRFYHPPSDKSTATSNKGNYSMFEPPKPLVPPPMRDYPAIPAARTLVESAWERSVATAKVLVKAASKRKEQSPEFEEKCLNQTLSNNDILPSKSSYLKNFDNRDYWPDPHETYDPKKPKERDTSSSSRKGRSRDKRRSGTPEHYSYIRQHRSKDATRRPAAADEWHDPWRRSKSPKTKRSSSQDSNDSATSSKSFSSRSSSYSESSAASSRSRSPSHSPSRTPPPPTKPHRESRSSVSCSSHSSCSSSGSEENSQSRSPSRETGPRSPPGAPVEEEVAPVLDGEEAHLTHLPPNKKIKLTLLYEKASNGLPQDSNGDSKKSKAKSGRLASRKRSTTHSEDSSSGHGGGSGSSRREELLKQLKAVEDAIARKRSRN